ncbi:MAG: glycosyltransferase family 2 protein, partial [Verrucomicrobiales bacterium]
MRERDDDDSPDRTWEIAGKIGRDDPHIRVIRRLGRRGLSSAVIEGFLAAKGSVLAVMDADGQHDMSLLPALRDAAERNRGIALGSRYAEGGGFGDWKKERLKLSQFATWLTHKVCKVKASDPMSGFFAVDRNVFESVVDKLNPKGFKILLDILVRVSADTPVTEIPFTFASRLRGESKLSWRVQLEFLEYLYEVALGKYVPLTFLKYCIVGSIGVLVHLAAYRTASFFFFEEPSGTTIRGFSAAVLVAIEVAIIFNFLLNNVWTFAR